MALSKSVGSSSWALQDFIICALQPSSESTVARVQLHRLCQNQPLLQRALQGSDIQSWKSRVWNRIPKIPEAHSKVPIQSKILRPADVQNILRVPLNLYKYKGSFRRLIAAISDLQMFKMGLQIFRTATSLSEQLFLFMFFSLQSHHLNWSTKQTKNCKKWLAAFMPMFLPQ